MSNTNMQSQPEDNEAVKAGPFPHGFFPSQFEWCRKNAVARKPQQKYGPWSCGKDHHATHCGIVTCKRVHGVQQTTRGQRAAAS